MLTVRVTDKSLHQRRQIDRQTVQKCGVSFTKASHFLYVFTSVRQTDRQTDRQTENSHTLITFFLFYFLCLSFFFSFLFAFVFFFCTLYFHVMVNGKNRLNKLLFLISQKKNVGIRHIFPFKLVSCIVLHRKKYNLESLYKPLNMRKKN